MTTEPLKEPVKVEAVKKSFRQSPNGVVITFEIHGSDDYAGLGAMPLGTRGILAFAEIVEEQT